jgi:hypothetical protein
VEASLDRFPKTAFPRGAVINGLVDKLSHFCTPKLTPYARMFLDRASFEHVLGLQLEEDATDAGFEGKCITSVRALREGGRTQWVLLRYSTHKG